MMRLSLTLLGDFQARIGPGPSLRLRTRKAQALLAFLAQPPGRPHSRDKLAALLWGDRPQGQARGRFRETLFALRRALAPTDPPCLALTGEALVLEATSLDVDAWTFERLAGSTDLAALAQAAALYRGEFLAGLDFRGTLFEDWLMAERERLRELALEALAKLLAQQRAAGDAEDALQTALRLIALDPLQEAVHRSLMRLYAELGRRGSALQQYQLCVAVLERELGVEPEEETRRLYQEIVTRPPAARSTARPDRAAEPRHDSSAGRAVAPLIGRDAEVERLRMALAESERGQGRVLAVLGEAGVGKSRLVAELIASAAPAGYAIMLGRCHESEQALPFAPWLDILKAARPLADAEWLAALAPALRRELGRLLVDFAPGAVADAGTPAPDYLMLFEAVSVLLAHVSGRQPLLVIVEDLHWADEMSAKLLGFIGRRLQASPALVLVTVRQEDLVDAAAVQAVLAELEAEPHAAVLALGPLSQHDTADLVRALARAESDDTTLARLSARAWQVSGGNPFVIVEAMRAASEPVVGGHDELPVPERVRSMIHRRLDRLDERARDLVAMAAAVGRDFEFGLLHRVSGFDEAGVAAAVEELIRRRVLHTVGDRLDFTHDRVREAAQDRILSSRRRGLHRRVAEALAELHADDLEPHRLALGLHCFEAEMWEPAVTHLRRAGTLALERYAKRDAVACFERALAALAHRPEDRSTLEQAFEIRIEMRPALNQLGEIQGVVKVLDEAARLAEGLDDDRRRGQVAAYLAVAHSLLGQLDESVASGERARAIALRLGDLKLRVVATGILGQAHNHRGAYARAVELATDNLATVPAEWVHETFGRFAPASIYDRVELARGLAELGRFAEAARYADEAVQLAEPRAHAYSLGLAHWATAAPALAQGAWSSARARLERAIEALGAASAILTLPWTVASLAWALAELGEERDALARVREGEQLAEDLAERGIVGTSGARLHALGRACLALGRVAEAMRLAERAVESSPGQSGYAAHAWRLLGDVTAHPDRHDPARSESCYRSALALAEPRGMRPLVAHCHLGLGRLHRRLGHDALAEDCLRIAATMFREMGMASQGDGP